MLGTVKAIDYTEEWILDVNGVPFGGPYNGKDSDGEYFDAYTATLLEDDGRKPLIVHYHGYDESGNPTDEPVFVGKELSREKRADGWWFRVALDKTNDKARQLWQAAKEGMLRASSGAIQHLVRPLTPEARQAQNGYMSMWPVAEISLMDISKGNYPANPYAVAMPVLQKRFKAADLTLTIPEAEETTDAESSPDAETSTPDQDNNQQLQQETPKMSDEQKPLTLEEIAAFLDKREADKAEAARVAALEAQAEELKALKAQIEEAQKQRTGTEQIKKMPNPVVEEKPVSQQVSVSSKWDGFSLGQLGFAYSCLKAAGHTPSSELYRALHNKAIKAVDAPDYFERHITRDKNGVIVRELSTEVSAGAIKAVKALNPMQMADTPATKSNELMYSTQASYGDEWVPDLWTPELWDLVRNNAQVLQRFRQYEVAGESLNIPARGGRTSVYKVAESTDQADLSLASGVNATMTKAATAKITLTPVKGMAWIGWSQEFNENSIAPVLSSLQEGLQMDLMEKIDEILISGDTQTSSANYSDNGNGSISTAWHLLMVNGLRDHALTNSNTVDIGTMDATKFLAVMGKLGTDGASAIDPAKLFWIASPGFYRTALALGEALTAEKTGSVGTFQNGRLMMVYGSDFTASDQFAKTDANGYINNTGASNTKGACLLIRPDRWAVGFGRRIIIESPARDLLSIVTDTQHLVASFKIDFKANGTAAAAMGYNTTLVG